MFSISPFGQAIESGSLSFPPNSPLPGTSQPDLPYILVGDEAFPLKHNLLRLYPGKNLPEAQAIYNYRLSRARRIIENSFGILASRWRIFRRSILANPNNVVTFTKAAIALHNFLRVTESSVYCPAGYIDAEDGDGNIVGGAWREETNGDTGLSAIGRTGANRYSASAAAIRDAYCKYFNSPTGEVRWQLNYVRRVN